MAGCIRRVPVCRPSERWRRSGSPKRASSVFPEDQAARCLAELVEGVGMVLKFVNLSVMAEGAAPALRGGGGMKVGEDQGAARFEDAGNLVQGGRLIADVTKGQCAECEVGRAGGDREGRGIGNGKPPAKPGLLRCHSRAWQTRGRCR